MVLLIAASLLAFAWQLRTMWPHTVDDSYITFRYADHLARGFGPNFNTDGTHAEGYSSPLWLLITTIPHLLGVDVVRFAKFAGVILTGLTGLLIAMLVTRSESGSSPERQRLLGAIGAAIFLTNLGAAVHACSGMETALFTFLLTWLFLLAINVLDSSRPGSFIALPLVALLVGLTRPEGNLVAGALIMACLFLLSRARRRRLWMTTALFYLLPAAIYFAWRVHYYGLWLPLPFYIKMAHQSRWLPGLSPVAWYAISIFQVMGIFALLGLARIGRSLVPAIVGMTMLLAFFLLPAHITAFEFRYVFPTLPIIVVLAAQGIGHIATWIQSWPRSTAQRSFAYVLLAAGVFMSIGVQLATVSGRRATLLAYAAGLENAHVRLAQHLAHISEPDSRRIAIGDAGAVPYYSRWQVLDSYGRNEPGLATAGRHDPNYIFQQEPDLIVLISHAADRFVSHENWWGTRLFEECVRRGMNRVACLPFSDDYFLWAWAEPGGDVAAHMESMEAVPRTGHPQSSRNHS
ncbi:MAG: hypothetical protein V3T70_10195 [Phycisphaerae bacterium]